MNQALILVNFGGPRSLKEISPFLVSLLTDQDVVQTAWPPFLHRFFFSRVARKRAVNIQPQYEEIGGSSPIYADTESIAKVLREQLNLPVVTFHRYLQSTHDQSFWEIENLSQQQIIVFPLFPQFTFATTGSIARLFSMSLSQRVSAKLQWVKSYAHHEAFIALFQKRISSFLHNEGWQEKDTLLLFSAHGVPQKFIDEGDPYEKECQISFNKIMKGFPSCKGLLSFQSKFGRGEWLKPYTITVCEEILSYLNGKKQVLFIPLSFTSDHIETLFEVEKEYMPVIRNQGIPTARLPAFNQGMDWADAITSILEEQNYVTTSMLIRRSPKKLARNEM